MQRTLKRFGLATLLLLINIQVVLAGEKPVLVLLPVEVSELEAEFEDEYGSALQAGFQSRYQSVLRP